MVVPGAVPRSKPRSLAAWSIRTGESPSGIRNNEARTADFQFTLVNTLGFELEWPSVRPR